MLVGAVRVYGETRDKAMVDALIVQQYLRDSGAKNIDVTIIADEVVFIQGAVDISYTIYGNFFRRFLDKYKVRKAIKVARKFNLRCEILWEC